LFSVKALTRRQRQVLDFIQREQDTKGIIPTYREIGDHFGFKSPNAVLAHVKALRRKGFLRNVTGRARTFQITNPAAPKQQFRPRVVSVPIYGSIPAGQPIDAMQESEACMLIDAETLGTKASARTFGLRARGQSMIGKSILDGDIAIIEHGLRPRPGDVVAVLIDNEVTLKTFIMQRNKPYLRSENPRSPNLIPQGELQIQGVMVALVRKRK
jgi:repressor LexA